MNSGEILKFWFEETAPKFHFNATAEFDALVRGQFEEFAIDQAAIASRGKHPWSENANDALALIILLDQFPRNMYRGTQAAFAWDQAALTAAKTAVSHGHDLMTDMARRSFIYMPYMHSEDLQDQDQCVALIDQRLNDENTLFHAKAHQKLIRQFGRFPHRNEILGRTTTPAEAQYLKDGGYSP